MACVAKRAISLPGRSALLPCTALQLLKDGGLKDIVGVPTSIRTYEQAKSEWQRQEGIAAALVAGTLLRESMCGGCSGRASPPSHPNANCCSAGLGSAPGWPLWASSSLVAPPAAGFLTIHNALPAGLGIPLATLDEQPKLDVAIDGADEVRGAPGCRLTARLLMCAVDLPEALPLRLPSVIRLLLCQHQPRCPPCCRVTVGMCLAAVLPLVLMTAHLLALRSLNIRRWTPTLTW